DFFIDMVNVDVFQNVVPQSGCKKIICIRKPGRHPSARRDSNLEKAKAGGPRLGDRAESPCKREILWVNSKAKGTRAGKNGRSARADRKSTRLNSSHDQISYAVF